MSNFDKRHIHYRQITKRRTHHHTHTHASTRHEPHKQHTYTHTVPLIYVICLPIYIRLYRPNSHSVENSPPSQHTYMSQIRCPRQREPKNKLERLSENLLFCRVSANVKRVIQCKCMLNIYNLMKSPERNQIRTTKLLVRFMIFPHFRSKNELCVCVWFKA